MYRRLFVISTSLLILSTHILMAGCEPAATPESETIQEEIINEGSPPEVIAVESLPEVIVEVPGPENLVVGDDPQNPDFPPTPTGGVPFEVSPVTIEKLKMVDCNEITDGNPCSRTEKEQFLPGDEACVTWVEGGTKENTTLWIDLIFERWDGVEYVTTDEIEKIEKIEEIGDQECRSTQIPNLPIPGRYRTKLYHPRDTTNPRISTPWSIASPTPTFTPIPTNTPTPTRTPSPSPTDTMTPSPPIPQASSVLWDLSHGPRVGSFGEYSPEGIFSDLADVLSQIGFTVQSNRGPLAQVDLLGFGIIVVSATSAVEQDFSTTEAEQIGQHILAGGNLLILGERPGFDNRIREVTDYFNMEVGLNPSLDTVTNLADHPIFGGVNEIQFLFDGGALSVDSPQGQIVASQDGSAAVVVFDFQPGRVVVIGDSNLFDNRGLRVNKQLAINVFQWLADVLDE